MGSYGRKRAGVVADREGAARQRRIFDVLRSYGGRRARPPAAADGMSGWKPDPPRWAMGRSANRMIACGCVLVLAMLGPSLRSG